MAISRQESGTGMDDILEVRGLEVSYVTRAGTLRAIRNLDLSLRRNETYGVVGESGCGKSTLAFAIMGYLERNALVTGGQILFNGEDLLRKSRSEMRSIWGKRISMIYQDPTAALNPSIKIGLQIAEILQVHEGVTLNGAWRQSVEMLSRLQIADPEMIADRYPHQLSGGMRQRVCIAMAFITKPDLLILDEPTTNLDVTTEANILDMLNALKSDFRATILYITHDLGVVYKVSDRVGVMYAGAFVEQGRIADIIGAPKHPYTRGLLSCIPEVLLDKSKRRLKPIAGTVAELNNIPKGCAFCPRCTYRRERCVEEDPPGRLYQDRVVRCHFASEVDEKELGLASCEAEPERIECEDLSREGVRPLLLSLSGVSKHFGEKSSMFSGGHAGKVRAVDGVSLAIPTQSTLGLVGESGCGKSTLLRVIAGLESATGGTVTFDEQDISVPIGKRTQEMTKRIQVVFQDPRSTLNPRRTVGQAIMRPIRLTGASLKEAEQRAKDLLEAVNLGCEYMDRYPEQVSGGQKQRIAIARAFASNPDLILCDEPTSSLDVSIQASIINLLLDLQRQKGTTYLFISHALGVVSYLCDAMAVMYLGSIVEYGPKSKVLAPPYHPYTEALLSSLSLPRENGSQKRIRLAGAVPSARDIPPGCRFHTRCPRKVGAICETESPPRIITDEDGDHYIYCHIPLEELKSTKPVFKEV
jgi:peptide/nickel transport system ATP-binding protein